MDLPTIYEGSLESMSLGRIFIPPEVTTSRSSSTTSSRDEYFYEEEAASSPGDEISPQSDTTTTAWRKKTHRFWVLAFLAMALAASAGVTLVVLSSSSSQRNHNDDTQATLPAVAQDRLKTPTQAAPTIPARPSAVTAQSSTIAPTVSPTTNQDAPGNVDADNNDSVLELTLVSQTARPAPTASPAAVPVVVLVSTVAGGVSPAVTTTHHTPPLRDTRTLKVWQYRLYSL